jgi:hypothetical protein
MTRLRALFRLTIARLLSLARDPQPSKSEGIANLFAEPNAQALRAGSEVGPLQIVETGLRRRLAKQ